jgi:hypothetical protein
MSFGSTTDFINTHLSNLHEHEPGGSFSFKNKPWRHLNVATVNDDLLSHHSQSL